MVARNMKMTDVAFSLNVPVTVQCREIMVSLDCSQEASFLIVHLSSLISYFQSLYVTLYSALL